MDIYGDDFSVMCFHSLIFWGCDIDWLYGHPAMGLSLLYFNEYLVGLM